MIIGYFDYIIFGVLVFLNAFFWKKRFKQNIGCLIGLIVFGIVLPITSMFFEIRRYNAEYKYIDAFELLYTYFRFPLYWVIGILQSILIVIKNRIVSR
jgi:hypothetical protein